MSHFRSFEDECLECDAFQNEQRWLIISKYEQSISD